MRTYTSRLYTANVCKFIFLILFLSLAISLSGCGGGNESNDSQNGPPNGGGPSSVSLRWHAPAFNDDNATPLTDLAGFKLYYGTESGKYTQMIDVGNATSANLDSLSKDTTYYFVVTAYDQYGNEGDFSREITKAL